MKICVYGASSTLIADNYIKSCENLGEEMAKRGHSLVFGGGGNGVMGAVARGVHRANGEIIGIAPSFFDVDGMLFDYCTKLIRTDTMRSRKQALEDAADAFVMAPGGLGTFDEFFEIITLKQLSRHSKAIVIYNIDGFFDDLLRFLNSCVEKKFIKKGCAKLVKSFDNSDELLDYLENYVPVDLDLLHTKDI